LSQFAGPMVARAGGGGDVTALLIALAAGCSTLLGGVLSFSLRDRLHLILGFTAGAVVGVALFDLLPEAYQLARASSVVRLTSLMSGAGFLFYLLLDRLTLLASLRSYAASSCEGTRPVRGILGALSLVAHSTCDGIAIGFAFQVSASIGTAVAAAVIAHDFSDGINTTNVILKNGGKTRQATYWLMTDALAPAVGIGSTFLVHLPQRAFAVVLAVFAGFFLYLGASDLVPESHHAHPKTFTTIATLLGAIVIYVTVSIAGHKPAVTFFENPCSPASQRPERDVTLYGLSGSRTAADMPRWARIGIIAGSRNFISGRYLVTFLVALSFFLQSYITQTHIHLSPSERRAAGQVLAGQSSTEEASQKGDPGKKPDNDDPAHCPLCQAVAAVGIFVAPSAPAIVVPVALSVPEWSTQHFASRRITPTHNWQGRAPPAI
jgi:zinc transporter ZupT